MSKAIWINIIVAIFLTSCQKSAIRNIPPEIAFNARFRSALEKFHRGENDDSIKALKELQGSYPEFSQDPDLLYILAMNYHKKKDWDNAVTTWEAFLAKGSILSDYGMYFLAEALSERKDFYLAKETLSSLITTSPESRYAELSQIKIAEYLVLMGNTEEGLTRYKSLMPSATYSADLLISLARSYEHLHMLEDAINTYLELYVKYPLSEYSEQAKKRIDELGKEINYKIPVDKIIQRISNLVNRTEYSLALKELETIELSELPMELQAKALFLRAICEYNLRFYPEALRSTDKCLAMNFKNADLFFLRGKIFSRIGKLDLAKEAYRKIISDYPDSEWIDNVYYKLAVIYNLENDYTEAMANIDYLINNYPNSDAIPDALWTKVWTSYRTGKTEDAIAVLKTLKRIEEGANRKNSQARYWLARMLEKTDKLAADQLYREILLNATPPDYYSLLALLKVNSSDEILRFEPAQPTQEITPYEGNMFHLEHAKKLISLGFKEDATVEARLAERESKSEEGKLLLVGKFYLDAGLYYDAIMFSKIYLSEYINNPGNLSTIAAKFAYPEGFSKIVKEYSRKYQIDPNLVFAIIHAESMFRSDSLSRANAIGLMQIIPSTGEYLASIAGLNYFNPEMLYDPDINLGLGIKYLSLLNSQYNRNLILILAHYNAGPTNLNAWLTKFNINEPDSFVENIPFPETKDYIKKVISNYCVYSWLYGGEINVKRIFGINSSGTQSTSLP